MDFATKAKLIYSGELAIFAIVFLVFAILKFAGVMGVSETRLKVFNWITIFGGSWIIADFIWAIFDKKRQKRIALIDKCIHLPAGLYLVTFDLYCLIAKPAIDSPICKFGVPIVLAYLCLCYTFEAIYHFKYPVPGIIDVVEQEKTLSEQQAQEENQPEDSSLEESESEDNKNE